MPSTLRALSSRRLSLALVIVSLTPLPLWSQVAPAPSPPPASGPEQPVVLAPFEVQTSTDRGYVAQNTSSGSRLNTSLMDTPAPISVFTQQFLNDIAATSIEDLSFYAPNTYQNEGYLSGTTQSGNNLGTNAGQFFFRGLPAGNGRSMDFFQYNIEIDTFDTERVEFSRGPNSVLFGLAAPAGVFNVTSKRADPTQTYVDTDLRTGSWDYARAALDINAAVIPSKLAIRIDPLLNDISGWRDYTYDHDKRLYTALRYQITPKTLLDVEYEGGQLSQSVQRPWGSLDQISGYLADGKPQVATAGGAAVPGTVSLSSGPYVVENTATGQIYNWQNQVTSVPLLTGGSQPDIFNFSQVPRNVVIGGPGTGDNVSYHNYSAFLQQELASKLFLELAYNYQHYQYHTTDVNPPTQLAVFYDPNAELPNGAPNPEAGQPYVEDNTIKRNRTEAVQNYRATLTYGLDLGKIFGRYQFLALGEQHVDHLISNEYFETIVDNPPVPSDPTNTGNLLYRRTYVNLNGPVSEITLPNYAQHSVNGATDLSNGQTIATAFLPDDTTQSDNRSYLTSGLLGGQAYFWGDRIVGTYGYREDHLVSYLSSPVRTAAFGPFSQGVYVAQPATSPNQTLTGGTRTEGLVFHAFKWISLTANRSSNFTPPGAGETLEPTNSPIPASVGKSVDYGVKLDLWDGRIFLTMTYYETAGVNNAAFFGLFDANITNIVNTLNSVGVLAANGLTAAQLTPSGSYYLYDDYSHGTEYEATANLTDHWRLYANFADDVTKQSNGGQSLVNYLNAYSPIFLAGNNANYTINGNGAVGKAGATNTVGGVLTTVETNLMNRITASNGEPELGIPQYSANIRTSYDLPFRWLQGVTIGGGFRWRSGVVAGYAVNRSPLYANANALVDGDISYRRKFTLAGRKLDWSLQLNVKNLLNNDDLLITNVYNTGAPQLYRFQDPRQWIISSNFKF